jgi:hypothetical protein
MGNKTRIVLTANMELVEAASSEAAGDKAENVGHPRDAAFAPENVVHPRGGAFTPENVVHPRSGVFTPENVVHPRSNPGGPSKLEFAEARVVRRISVSQDDEGNIFLDLEE